MSDNSKPVAVVLFSGGIDSSTVVAKLMNSGWSVIGMFVRYGQKHERKEWGAAQIIAHHFGIELKTVSLPIASLFGASALTSDEIKVPHAHFEDEVQKSTIVPNRNMILISIATAYAIPRGARAVAIGCHGGDGPIYPDCRPEFLYALEDAMALCDNTSITLLAPFLRQNKGSIVKTARLLNVPIGLCWSCYEGGDEPCGKCGACVERMEAGA